MNREQFEEEMKDIALIFSIISVYALAVIIPVSIVIAIIKGTGVPVGLLIAIGILYAFIRWMER